MEPFADAFRDCKEFLELHQEDFMAHLHLEAQKDLKKDTKKLLNMFLIKTKIILDK